MDILGQSYGNLSIPLYVAAETSVVPEEAAEYRVRREFLGTGSPFIRRNRGASPSMESLRDTLTTAEYETLRR